MIRIHSGVPIIPRQFAKCRRLFAREPTQNAATPRNSVSGASLQNLAGGSTPGTRSALAKLKTFSHMATVVYPGAKYGKIRPRPPEQNSRAPRERRMCPSSQTVNISLVKNIALRERTKLQFRPEAFNFLNRPNFDLADIFFGSPTIGHVLSVQSPRHIQFGLKLLF